MYQKAYPPAERGSKDAEKMGQTVFTYQFAARLKPELHLKVAKSDGAFKQLLIRARLEEAKLRDLQTDSIITKQTAERNQKRRVIQATRKGDRPQVLYLWTSGPFEGTLPTITKRNTCGVTWTEPKEW